MHNPITVQDSQTIGNAKIDMCMAREEKLSNLKLKRLS
jgi:hypothetical protein